MPVFVGASIRLPDNSEIAGLSDVCGGRRMSSSHYPSHKIGGPCVEIYGPKLICGVPRYLCDDCRGESLILPCDSAKAIIANMADCRNCVNHEASLVASVHGSRLRACMVEPCKFERKVK